MLSYLTLQLADSAQYVDLSTLHTSAVDPSSVAQDDPATWWERIREFAKKALIGLLIFIGVIFLLGLFVGLWLGKKWGRRSAANDFEEAQEARQDLRREM